MTLTRPLCSLDVETTGTDPVRDRIVQFGVTVLHLDGSRTQWSALVNPGIPIPAEATAVHGITDEMVQHERTFEDLAKKLVIGLEGKDLLGFNLRRFDLPIIDEELRRCGMKLDLSGVRIIDACAIFYKKEERTLSAAVKFYCGREHEGAHGALSDSDATLNVFLAQQERYPELGTIDQAASFSAPEGAADLAGKLFRDPVGDLRFSFGKYKGELVRDHPDYANWMARSGFPSETIEWLDKELLL